jgi:dimethylargininase
MFTHAITRLPGPDFASGLTTARQGRPNYRLMMDQHQAYVGALRQAGLEVTVLQAQPGLPDAYFVEDVAVVLPQVAILTRPGAPSRRGEVAAIRPALAHFRPVVTIEPPGTLEGGDVLPVGDHFFVGISERTNANGAEQFGRLVASHGFDWTAVPVDSGVHLKSSVNRVGGRTLLLTASFAQKPEFSAFEHIVVEEDETYATNVLHVNDRLIIPSGYPETRVKLARLGLPIVELDVSEARKMDGGLTCMSLRF